MSAVVSLQLLELAPRPCPFCGSAGARLIVDDDFVQCVECGASGPECDKRGRGYVPLNASVEAWNRRKRVVENLQEGLVRQLARVRDEVIPAYQSIGAPGTFALAMIRADVKFADDALAGGDVIEMARAYRRLEGIKT